MQRPNGYYWCREYDTWEVAYWNGEYWECAGQPFPYSNAIWDEIDPDPITRNIKTTL